MKSSLSTVNHYRTKGQRITFVLLLSLFLMPVAWPQVVCEGKTPQAEKVLAYLRSLGNGRYMFGQIATWVHNENPDMDHGVPVVYTPFVESDDRNKWHAKAGCENAIKLYRLVHDYFTNDKGLDNIIWAYHTTANHGVLEKYYPGDAYVDVLGKSAYGTGLNFSEYNWAVEKKKNAGKVIWWSELEIRGRSYPAGIKGVRLPHRGYIVRQVVLDNEKGLRLIIPMAQVDYPFDDAQSLP